MDSKTLDQIAERFSEHSPLLHQPVQEEKTTYSCAGRAKAILIPATVISLWLTTLSILMFIGYEQTHELNLLRPNATNITEFLETNHTAQVLWEVSGATTISCVILYIAGFILFSALKERIQNQLASWWNTPSSPALFPAADKKNTDSNSIFIAKLDDDTTVPSIRITNIA